MSNRGWIGVDFDGTLAEYDRWRGVEHCGAPIPLMVARVKEWLAAGNEVKIFTARVYSDGTPKRDADVMIARTAIAQWCLEHIGQVLEITNIKDFGMIELWDDRAVSVMKNTGYAVRAA